MRDPGAWAVLAGGTRAARRVPGWRGREAACGGGAG